ncbi:LOW QUALITY PROTEIN: uncharacterized protein EMH_0032180 [Eimeria mitis]|uniref:Uncharacterized protein n=1 Tax=Eimeria mitis TaxID=44415 RepID=U6JVD9_9EIME|nr:LOW QUALITY PROTEIN: uncharacterized protein EMH_0032180 [Eimeria mitis]CDJ27483.1 hypothetical protein EMH_0032180 [Eimeria mitis]
MEEAKPSTPSLSLSGEAPTFDGAKSSDAISIKHREATGVPEAPIFPLRPLSAASSIGRQLWRGKSSPFVLQVLLLLFLLALLRNPASAAGPRNQNGSAGLSLVSAAAEKVKASVTPVDSNLRSFNSVQGGFEDGMQTPKGPSAAPSPRQKDSPAQISSSSDAAESQESNGNKNKIVPESQAVPPGLAAGINIAIRRPFDLLRRAAAVFGDSPWILTSEEEAGEGFLEISYKQGYAVSLAVGSGLDRLVLPSQLPQRDGANEPLRLVGTWAANSVELLLADFGAGAFGMTVVPMHPDMNARRFLEVMIHTQMTHLCTDWRHLEIVLDLREGGQLSNLSVVITLDAALDLTLVDFWELADSPDGIGEEQRLKNITRSGFDTEEIAAVIYPRALSMPFNGAMLTNENVLASLDTLTDWRARVLSIVEGDRVLCIDSLASIHQRVITASNSGSNLAGFLTLGEDLAALQPTIVAASGGILPMLHSAAKRTLKSLGRLRRFWVLLKLKWRARKYWQMGDFEILSRLTFQWFPSLTLLFVILFL